KSRWSHRHSVQRRSWSQPPERQFHWCRISLQIKLLAGLPIPQLAGHLRQRGFTSVFYAARLFASNVPPSCCINPSVSQLLQLSTTLPLLTRAMVIPVTENRFPVRGKPLSSPS